MHGVYPEKVILKEKIREGAQQELLRFFLLIKAVDDVKKYRNLAKFVLSS